MAGPGRHVRARSLSITAGDDVAYAQALLRCGSPQQLADEPWSRLRLTLGLRKGQGRWRVAHEHHSFPHTSGDREGAPASRRPATIIVSGALYVDPADRDAYLAARVPILAHARTAAGCLDFSLSPDLLDAGRINVHEHRLSHDDLLAYRAGDGPQLDDSIAVLGADVALHHISSSEAP